MKRAYLCLLSMLTGCAMEPPPPPDIAAPTQYTRALLAEQTTTADARAGHAQTLVSGKDIPAEWWKLFQSPALDELVRMALEQSPTLAQARAKLTQAQENLSATRGGTQIPKVDAQAAANRIDVGAAPLPVASPFDLYLATVNVSYTLDLFGASRRELEALQAQVDFQRYEFEAARLTLAGNVVTAAIREASLREQLATTEASVAIEARQVVITERLEELGTAAHADVVAQRLELARIRALLPELRSQLEQVRNRLAVYTGQTPAEARLPEFRLSDLQLPAELPLSLPSELTRQRPDIRAAEALLLQAGARVGVATANMFPRITLSANLGSLATDSSDLFTSGSDFTFLLGSLTQPIFHGGELRARRRAAIAAYEQAGAAYRQAVLQGFQNVADVLQALHADAEILAQRAEAETMARRYYDITSARYQAGGVSQYFLLDAQRKLLDTSRERTQAAANRHADSAALLQALGGGWWQETPKAQ